MVLTFESVAIQMKPCQQYFHMILFILKYFSKWNLGFVLNFDFRHSWEWKGPPAISVNSKLDYLEIQHHRSRFGLIPNPNPRSRGARRINALWTKLQPITGQPLFVVNKYYLEVCNAGFYQSHNSKYYVYHSGWSLLLNSLVNTMMPKRPQPGWDGSGKTSTKNST